MKSVSTLTGQRLRAALDRLVTGQSRCTDGRLTVVNLAREAGVSRATANRASVILADLRDHAAQIASKREQSVASPTAINEERESRERDHILAQHILVRALLTREAQRRAALSGKIVQIVPS